MGCTSKGVSCSSRGVPTPCLSTGALRPGRVNRHPVMNRPPSPRAWLDVGGVVSGAAWIKSRSSYLQAA